MLACLKGKPCKKMADFISVVGGLGSAAVGWVALNFFGKPILTLREKRREALEVGERHAYVGLHDTPHLSNDDPLSRPARDEYQKRAVSELRDIGNCLRAHARERTLSTRIYCRFLDYDLDKAASALFGLSEAARAPYQYDQKVRRLTLHVLFVALGSTHHLSSGEVATARAEMKNWHDGNRGMTVF
jgi:hypothetical protein